MPKINLLNTSNVNNGNFSNKITQIDKINQKIASLEENNSFNIITELKSGNLDLSIQNIEISGILQFNNYKFDATNVQPGEVLTFSNEKFMFTDVSNVMMTSIENNYFTKEELTRGHLDLSLANLDVSYLDVCFNLFANNVFCNNFDVSFLFKAIDASCINLDVSNILRVGQGFGAAFAAAVPTAALTSAADELSTANLVTIKIFAMDIYAASDISCAAIYANTSTVNQDVVISDDRLKHNEINITNGLNVITSLAPQFYQKTTTFKDADFSGTLNENFIYEAGLIAQDVEAINDLSFSVIQGDDNTPYSLNYNNIFVYGLAAIKELNTTIIDLSNNLLSATNRVTQLEQENTTIKSSLNQLLTAAGLSNI